MNTRKKFIENVGRIGTIALLFYVPLFLNGCAMIPKESVKLSEGLGSMISHSRTSHVNLVNRYFSERIEALKTFALSEYKPAFIKNVQKRLKEQGQEFTLERYVGRGLKLASLERYEIPQLSS